METVAVARQGMATRFEIVLQGENPVALRAAAEEALDEIERLDAQLSLYRPTSEISHINSRAAIESVRVEPGLFRLLQRAQKLQEESGGTFDITVAPLMRCWGFMGGSGQMPSPEQIGAARAKIGMNLVRLRESDFTIRFDRAGVMLDLGAIGKGYALDQAAEILVEAGVTRALLHGGTSTVYAIGTPADAEAWKIGIDRPQTDTDRAAESQPVVPTSAPDPRPVLAVVELKNEAMSVSAVHGKSFSADGKTYGHVLDPRTGGPTQGALLAAVVLPSATETDALSTALLIEGCAGYEKIVRLRPGMRALVVSAADSEGDWRIESTGIELK